MGICTSEESVDCKEEREKSMADDIADELNRLENQYTEEVRGITPNILTTETEKLFFYRKQYNG